MTYLTYFAITLLAMHSMKSATLLTPIIPLINPAVLQINAFKNFLTSFQLELASPAEFEFRKTIFVAKQAEIDTFNKLGRSYKKGLNPLSMLTLEEKYKLLGAIESPVQSSTAQIARADGTEPTSAISLDQNDVQLRAALSNDKDASFIDDLIFRFISPQKKDFVAEGKVTSVKNQRGCGSCWAFAAAAAVESAQRIKNGATLDLAEQKIVDCSHERGSGGCGGGYSNGALDHFMTKGVPQETSYPYTGVNGVCKSLPAGTFLKKIAGYVEVQPGNMVTYLANLRYRPMTTYFYVVKDFFDYASGVFDANTDCAGISNKINHAVLAVKYDLTVAKPYVRFKNSWGPSWGEGGFFNLPIKKLIFQNGPCNMIRAHGTFFPLL